MFLAVLRIYLSVWRNRPRTDSYSSLWSPSDFFPSCNLGNQLLSYPQPAGPANTISELHLLLINREPPDSVELFHTGGGRCPLVNLLLSGPLLPRRRCGSGGCRPLFLWIGQGEAWACPSSLENAKPWGSRALFRTHRSHPKKNGVKLRRLRELPFSWRRTRTRTFWIRMPWVLPTRPHLCAFPESPVLGEQVKHTNEMTTTWLHSAGWLIPRLGRAHSPLTP